MLDNDDENNDDEYVGSYMSVGLDTIWWIKFSEYSTYNVNCDSLSFNYLSYISYMKNIISFPLMHI